MFFVRLAAKLGIWLFLGWLEAAYDTSWQAFRCYQCV